MLPALQYWNFLVTMLLPVKTPLPALQEAVKCRSGRGCALADLTPNALQDVVDAAAQRVLEIYQGYAQTRANPVKKPRCSCCSVQ